MDYTSQASQQHVYASPATYYSSTAATTNPNPSSTTAALDVLRTPGADAYVSPSVGYSAAQYQAATYAYSQATPGLGLASLYYAANPATSVYRPVNNKNKIKKGTPEDMETKKQKLIQGGVKANSLRTCSVCNIVCNSDKVFAAHLASEKHLSKVTGRPSGEKARLAMSLSQIFTQPVGTSLAAAKSKPKKKKKTAKTPGLVVQPVYCDLCKSTCNTLEVYNLHINGKKHTKNLKSLMNPTVTPPVNTNTNNNNKNNNNNNNNSNNNNCMSNDDNNKNPQNEHAADAPAAVAALAGESEGDNNSGQKTKRKAKRVSKEDLETKKQKVLQGGANAGAVRVCEICTVVCNSQRVFEYHVAGKSHNNMLRKRGLAPQAPQTVSAQTPAVTTASTG